MGAPISIFVMANKQPACCRVDSRSASTILYIIFIIFFSLSSPCQHKRQRSADRDGYWTDKGAGRRASLEWTLEFERHKLTSVIYHSVPILLSCRQAALRRDEAALRSRCRHCRGTKIKNNSVSEKKTEPLRGQSNVKLNGRDAKRETQNSDVDIISVSSFRPHRHLKAFVSDFSCCRRFQEP